MNDTVIVVMSVALFNGSGRPYVLFPFVACEVFGLELIFSSA